MPKTFTLSHPALGPTIRYLRRRARMNQSDLRAAVAERGGSLGQAWLSRIERGKAEPSERMVDQILEALNSDRYELAQVLDRPIAEIEAAADDPDGAPLLWTWSAPVAGVAAEPSPLHMRSPRTSRLRSQLMASQPLASTAPMASASFLSAPLASESSPAAPALAEATTEFIEAYQELDEEGRRELLAAIRALRS